MEFTLRIVQKKPAFCLRADIFHGPIDCISRDFQEMLFRVMFCLSTVQLGNRQTFAFHG